MATGTEHPIDKNNVYRDTVDDYVRYVTIEGFYVDESGATQVKVGQYTNKPIDAQNSAGHLTGVSGRRTLAVNDIRDRILKGELIFDGKY